MARKPKLTAYQIKAQEAIDAQMKANETKAIAQLENPEVVNALIEQQDDVMLDGMLAELEKAYGKPVYAINFNGSASKVIAIANALTFAPKGVRELIPASMYTLLSERVRDSIIENSGRFPYFRKPVMLEMADGTVQEFDKESSEVAMNGTRANLDKLNASLFLAKMSLGLNGDVEVTEIAYNSEWNRAIIKAEKDKLSDTLLEEAVA